MTHVPVSALRSAERCPMNLAPAASRRPMAFPTRVDAAIPIKAEGQRSSDEYEWAGRKEDKGRAKKEREGKDNDRRNGSLPMPNGMVFKTRKVDPGKEFNIYAR